MPGIAPIGEPYTSVLFGKDTISGDGWTDSGGDSHAVYDIEYSGRFGWVPIIWDTTFPNGSKNVYFKGFQPVFIQTLYAGCKGNGSCDFIHNPGQSTGNVGSMATNDKLDAASGMTIQLSMLPVELQESQQQTLTDRPGLELMR